MDAFELLELKEVYFSRCNVSLLKIKLGIIWIILKDILKPIPKFSIIGVKALVRNCPSLEVLDLSECKEIDDECVDVITSSLPRLTTLKLNRCDKISEKCFEILYKNCTQLKVS